MTTLLRSRYIGLALGLALVLGCFPAPAQARMVGSLPSGAGGLTARQAAEAKAKRLLGEAKVAEVLAAHGLTAEQIASRLDRLDDRQLEELTRHLETIQAAQGSSTALVGIALAIILLGALIYMLVEAA